MLDINTWLFLAFVSPNTSFVTFFGLKQKWHSTLSTSKEWQMNSVDIVIWNNFIKVSTDDMIDWAYQFLLGTCEVPVTVQRKAPHCSLAHPENNLNSVRIMLLQNACCGQGTDKWLAIENRNEYQLKKKTVNGHSDMKKISNYFLNLIIELISFCFGLYQLKKWSLGVVLGIWPSSLFKRKKKSSLIGIRVESMLIQ